MSIGSQNAAAAGKLAGVMGWPIGHSLSPLLHRYWLSQLNIKGDYIPLMIRPQNLEAALRSLVPMGFSGVNITVPHKEMTAKLVDRLDPLARRIGAVNTVIVDHNGRLFGRNTDAGGFLAHLQQSAPRWRAKNAHSLVLGAGGAAKAVVVALLDAGAAQIYIANRTQERAQSLVAALDDKRVVAAGWQDRTALLKDVDLLVNSTSLGMVGQAPLDISLSLMPSGSVVYDLVYRPLQTELLKKAKARDLIAVDGLGMLIHQAVPAFDAFFGQKPSVDAQVQDLLLKALDGD
ncbi:shikimate dehydrogenase (NADP(+)) [Iodidimonas gelatinilytica]|uniref:Shikimate dehydrogenase (NADP(+)) n=1 Tax=Iodidimonas gelatinilytica TaxID=1236966 RepID=A0A5A7MR85_9PROT|nr:shikimate dehydrogenase [Iodidimonas gelatinilytica]GEQ97495.1 shikimate dehydrogenase (NADP(+)) [Iodidimonas gelatinilytica]